jgi:hypothetical protein
MSSIASNAEDLILNADGGSSTVKFKIDGTEKASISSAGAFTSTTIDATKLTGALPAISGAALTGVGVAGITSNADATAMTITSDEKIGIGTASPTRTVDINHASTAPDLRLGCDGADAPMVIMDSDMSSAADPLAHIVFRWNNTDAALISAYAGADTTNKDDGGLTFKTRTSGSALATRLDLTADGRGLSQFTAKAWARIDMESATANLVDSHNISSLTDRAVGKGTVTFANNMANVNYTAVGNAFDGGGENDVRTLNHSNETTWSTSAFSFYTIDSANVQDVQNATLLFFGD